MSDVVHYAKDGDVAVIELDNPPVNALASEVLAGILSAHERAENDAQVRAIVLFGRGGTFSGGADIRAFSQTGSAGPTLRDAIAALERGHKPVIAAIAGNALGGGLEISLAADYRCAERSAKIGLPEVKLGLLPGAGGTQRLPRLAGIEAAVALITSGESVSAARAAELGVIDEIVDGDLRAVAIASARRLAATGQRRRVRDLPLRGSADAIATARGNAAAPERGGLAVHRALDAVAIAGTVDFEAGLRRERELFEELRASEQSVALRHVFFAEREAAKVPGLAADAHPLPIASAAVIGGGTMGSGIAMVFANAGIPVTLLELASDALERARSSIAGNYASSLRKGRLSQSDLDRRLAAIAYTTDYAAVRGADIIIEAVFEDLAVKRDVFAKLDTVAKPGAILASNTSTLDVDAIAAATSRPADVIGTHFFSPANVMRLLEVVRGGATSDRAIATVMRLAKTLGKVAVLVGNGDGFVGNRMLYAYKAEADRLLEEGALPFEIDAALRDFGFPMGPFAMSDLAGLDVGWRIRKRKGLPPNIADALCEQGRFGQKTGAGFYRYAAVDRTPQRDPEVEALVVAASAQRGIARRSIAAAEIVRRCLDPLIAEGARILDEGLAIRPGDVDVIWIYGYGFPRYRGGPMHYGATRPAHAHEAAR